MSQISLIPEIPTVDSPDSDEWYSPRLIVEPARSAMGGIDLDPASCAQAQEIVKAATYYIKEDNGLKLPWWGNVWLNPPYSTGLIEKFVTKLLDAVFEEMVVRQACLLVNNATDTRWGQLALGSADAVCFLKGRLRFYGPLAGSNSPAHGQMLIYYGTEPNRFAKALEGKGVVLK